MSADAEAASPKPGDYLYSTCAATDVYEVIAVGVDANGCPTIDVRVLDLDDVLHFEHDDDGWIAPLTRAELPEGVHVILRGMQWRPSGDGIQVNAPVGGCYRCCYYLLIHEQRSS